MHGHCTGGKETPVYKAWTSIKQRLPPELRTLAHFQIFAKKWEAASVTSGPETTKQTEPG
jgi:hypothetical protein